MSFTPDASFPDGVTARAATAHDAETVSCLLEAAGLVPIDESSQFGPQYVIAVDADSAIIGAAGVERYGADGLLRSVVVHPDWRDRGIGSALVRDRFSWAERAGIRTLYLLTSTAADYWVTAGFAVIGRSEAPSGIAGSHEWTSACPSSATAMRRAVS